MSGVKQNPFKFCGESSTWDTFNPNFYDEEELTEALKIIEKLAAGDASNSATKVYLLNGVIKTSGYSSKNNCLYVDWFSAYSKERSTFASWYYNSSSYFQRLKELFINETLVLLENGIIARLSDYQKANLAPWTHMYDGHDLIEHSHYWENENILYHISLEKYMANYKDSQKS